MAKIVNVSDAWMWLGAEMERLEREEVKAGSQLATGLCRLISDARWPCENDTDLVKRFGASVARPTLDRMDDEMHEQTLVTRSAWLGKRGKDYGVRALWCYLMAEVARG